MKYIFTPKLALITTLVLLCCAIKAETVNYATDNGFNYILDTETQKATLTKYSGEATKVIIPETVTYEGKAYKVTGVGEGCFLACTSLTSIEIPSSVTSLGESCFFACTSLISIEIPSSVTSLGESCFNSCESLASIEIPSSVTSLGNLCFASCRSLELIVVDAGNTCYDSREGCNAIIETKSNTMLAGCKNTVIPSSVTSLGDYCFYCCYSLASIKIPLSVTSIGYACFEDCYSLASIKIPSSVTSLGERCFCGCSLESIVVDAGNTCYDSREGCNAIIETKSNTMLAGCKNTVIPSSVTSLGDYCFYRCYSLASIKIPSSVTSIGYACFENCYSLASIKIPSSVTSLPDWCFGGCSSLTSIEIPSSVTSLGERCFYGCYLESIVVDAGNTCYDSREGCNAIIETKSNTMLAGCKNTVIPSSVTSLGDYCFYRCYSLASIKIPSSVTSIGYACFEDCYSLASIEIPSSVTGLPGWCFSGCSSLTSIEIPSAVTSLGESCFEGCSSLKTVINKMGNVITSQNLFSSTPIEEATLYILSHLIDTYKSTSPWSDFGTIIPFGDSNGNGTVNIADAVNTANYAVGIEVEDFCFMAADVNDDDEVTVADASGTVTIILAQPVQESRHSVRSLSTPLPNGADRLTISDYSATVGETAKVSISLDNSVDYAALQADIVLPEGLTLQSITGGIRAAGHSLTTRQIDSRRVRVVLFDLGNSTFADSREALLDLKVRVEDINAGDIIIENIIASDASANAYRLVSAGGHRDVITGTDRVPSGNSVRIEAANGSINVYNAAGSTVAVYGTDGRVLARFVAKNETEQYKTAPGFYIVTVGNRMVKIMVK